MNKEEKNPPISVDNIYRLNGRVTPSKGYPFRPSACAGHVCI